MVGFRSFFLTLGHFLSKKKKRLNLISVEVNRVWFSLSRCLSVWFLRGFWRSCAEFNQEQKRFSGTLSFVTCWVLDLRFDVWLWKVPESSRTNGHQRQQTEKRHQVPEKRYDFFISSDQIFCGIFCWKCVRFFPDFYLYEIDHFLNTSEFIQYFFWEYDKITQFYSFSVKLLSWICCEIWVIFLLSGNKSMKRSAAKWH